MCLITKSDQSGPKRTKSEQIELIRHEIGNLKYQIRSNISNERNCKYSEYAIFVFISLIFELFRHCDIFCLSFYFIWTLEKTEGQLRFDNPEILATLSTGRRHKQNNNKTQHIKLKR